MTDKQISPIEPTPVPDQASDQALKLVEQDSAAPKVEVKDALLESIALKEALSGESGMAGMGVQESPKKDPIIPTVMSAPTAEPSFRQQIEAVRARNEPDMILLLTALDHYVDVMAPGKPMTGPEGVKHQYKLWDALHRVLEQAPLPMFNRMWNIVIAYFREYQKGAFAISHSNRFTEYWGRNLDHLEAYLELLDLLQISATRPKHISKFKSIEKVIAKVYTDVGRGRLTSFYS